MDDSHLLPTTRMWLVGRRTHDRLYELTCSADCGKNDSDGPDEVARARSLTNRLTGCEVRLFLKWDSFVDMLGTLSAADAAGAPVVIVDADMAGVARLRWLRAYRQQKPDLAVVGYMAAAHTTLAMQTAALDFPACITRRDTTGSWEALFEALGRGLPYHSPGWYDLLRAAGMLFAGDHSPVYPMAHWVSSPECPSKSQLSRQKAAFSTI